MICIHGFAGMTNCAGRHAMHVVTQDKATHLQQGVLTLGWFCIGST